MKKILVATVATAALALAAPAFAQVAGDVNRTVQVQAMPPAPTDPLAQTTEDAQDAVDSTTDEAQESAVAPPQAEGSVSADSTVVAPPADGQVSAETETMTEEPMAESTAEASINAPSVQADATASTEELPAEVQQAVNDGSYTTDDLNRAQLAALQSPTQASR
jgi:hypothetical protein